MGSAVPRCVVASGGTLETALLPGRVLSLRADYGLDVGCALSHEALDFVTRTAVRAISGREPYIDNTQFDGDGGVPLHLVWSEADVCVIHPASARILAECAMGSVTDAVTRMFAFTPKDRVAIAPAVHQKMDPRPYRRHLDELRDLGCTILGGDDLHADWRSVERWVVSRLGLVKVEPANVIRLHELT